MRTASCKAKARKFQQAVCKFIVESFTELQPDDVVSTSMGASGIDCRLSPLAQKLFPVSIECKNTASIPGKDALAQAEYNCYPDTVPVVAWHRARTSMDNGEPTVLISLKNLVELIKIVREQERAKD